MKLRNRILSAIMAVVATMSFACISAFAAEPSIALTPSATEVKAGDTFTVDVATVDNPGVYYLELVVSSDAGLTLTSVADKELYEGATLDKDYAKAEYKLAWWIDDLCESESTASGSAATLTYTVAADATPGDYKVTVKGGNSDNVAFEGVNFGTATTTIKVVEDAPVVETADATFYAEALNPAGYKGVTFSFTSTANGAVTYNVPFGIDVQNAEKVLVGLTVSAIPSTDTVTCDDADLYVE